MVQCKMNQEKKYKNSLVVLTECLNNTISQTINNIRVTDLGLVKGKNLLWKKTFKKFTIKLKSSFNL